jgi:hypothetical protein
MLKKLIKQKMKKQKQKQKQKNVTDNPHEMAFSAEGRNCPLNLFPLRASHQGGKITRRET